MTVKKSKAEKFIDYNYRELKDLGKHFLTISTASAVFVLAFYEKLTPVGESINLLSSPMKTGGILFALSIVFCWIGLLNNYIAGCGASKSMMWKIGRNYRLFTRLTYISYIIAGGSFIVAYLILLLAGIK